MSLLQTGFLFLQEHLFQSTSCVVEGLLYGTRSAVVEGSQFPNRLSLHVVAKEQFFVMRTKPRQARPYTLLHLPSQQTGLRQINGVRHTLRYPLAQTYLVAPGPTFRAKEVHDMVLCGPLQPRIKPGGREGGRHNNVVCQNTPDKLHGAIFPVFPREAVAPGVP